MALGSLLLVLASAFMHALWNALLKRQRDVEAATVAVLALATLASLAAALLASLFGAPFTRLDGLLWALAAGVCEAGYIATLAAALSRAPLGLAYTVSRGGAIALVWPLSAIFLGEAVTPVRGAGVLLVLGGLYAAGVEPRRKAAAAGPGAPAESASADGGPRRSGGAQEAAEAGPGAPAESAKADGAGAHGGPRRSGRVHGAKPAGAGGLEWALACAACIAGFHMCYKMALAAGAAPAPLFAVSLVVALPPNLWRLGANRRERLTAALRGAPGALIGGGLACAASFLAFLGALAVSGAGLILTLRNTSVIFAQGLSYAIGEPPTRRRLLGALLVAVGSAAAAW